MEAGARGAFSPPRFPRSLVIIFFPPGAQRSYKKEGRERAVFLTTGSAVWYL
jgi:hypothetical protein